MLVTAIPVTVVFRLIEGQYPSQVLQPIPLFADHKEHRGRGQLRASPRQHRRADPGAAGDPHH
jgi:hypothetical protein